MDRCSTRCAHAIVDSARTIGGGGMTLQRLVTVCQGRADYARISIVREVRSRDA